jgi:hypothetical protein
VHPSIKIEEVLKPYWNDEPGNAQKELEVKKERCGMHIEDLKICRIISMPGQKCKT